LKNLSLNFPIQNSNPHPHSATNTLNSLSTAANPFLASSRNLTDNKAYLKDVLKPIDVWREQRVQISLRLVKAGWALL